MVSSFTGQIKRVTRKPNQFTRWVQSQFTRSNDYLLSTLQSSGTHWIQYLLAKSIVDYFELDYEFKNIHPLEVIPPFGPNLSHCAKEEFFCIQHEQIPRIEATHLRCSFPWSICFRRKKLILLVRNLQDALISHYEKFLRKNDPISFRDFLRNRDQRVSTMSRQGSLAGRVHFLNSWWTFLNSTPSYRSIIIKFEQLKSSPHAQLERCLTFLGLNDFDDDFLDTVIEFCRLENMKKISRQALKQGTYRDGMEDEEKDALNKGKMRDKQAYFTGKSKSYFYEYISEHLKHDFGYEY